MSLSHVTPDTTVPHEKTILEVIDKNKTFPSQEGLKMKYVIRFTDDYAAEYCPLVKDGLNPDIKAGNKFLFRISYRKPIGDEIVPFIAPPGVKPEQLVGKVFNAHGHPAVIALNAASHIYAAKIKADATLQSTNASIPSASAIQIEEYGISNMLEDADLIHKWIIDTMRSGEPTT